MAESPETKLYIQQTLVEAIHRWMSPAEVYDIIQNHEAFIIAPEPPDRPISGSLFLFDRKVLRHFRQDGHNWRNRRGGKTVKEVHQRLKVGSEEVLHCYHAHLEENESFQRRCYWLIEDARSHIVLVHYMDIKKMHMEFERMLSLSSSNPSVSVPGNQEELEQLDNCTAESMEAHTTNPGGDINSEEINVDLISAENITNSVMGPFKGDKINISYEDLEQHFGKNLNEVAASIGVSRSTIKRICRDKGIFRWPSHMRNKPSPFSRSRGCNTNPTSVLRRSPRRKVADVQEDDGVLPHKNMESTIQDGGMVTIKASYENIIIKFQLSNLSNLVVLEQEVGKRLNFNVGDFKMEYQDEENDWVSILCDADLLFCFKSMNLLGNSIIRMKVRVCCTPS